jgi:hypothetical protein
MVSFIESNHTTPLACMAQIGNGFFRRNCNRLRPCPLHDLQAHPPLPSQGVEAPQTSAPCPLPAPRLFQEDTAA